MQAHMSAIRNYAQVREFVTKVAQVYRALGPVYDADQIKMMQFAIEQAETHDLWEERDAVARLLTPQRDAGMLLTKEYGKRMARQSVTALFGGL